MEPTQPDRDIRGVNESSRSAAMTVLTVVTMAWVVARIASAELLFEPSLHRHADESSPPAPQRIWPTTKPRPMPTFSSNDRSRWATVRALVDHGTFSIGQGTFDTELGKYRGGRGFESGIIAEDGWGTVDKMMDPKTGRFYSTKPPLLTVLAALEYAILKTLFGWSITEQPQLVVKTILLTLNALPLLGYLLLLRRSLERFGQTDWGILLTFASGCLGTFVTTFSNTLNNHVPAAVITMALLALLLDEVPPSRRRLVAIGLLSGILVCFELPAASLSACVLAYLLVRHGSGAAVWAVSTAAIPLVVSLLLNRYAIGEWLPAYSKVGSEWYQYPGSHWTPPAPNQTKHGIDWARLHESRGAYIFHFLVGHHGWFSLTPIWLGSLISLLAPQRVGWPYPRFFHIVAVLVSAVVFGFYLARTDNYGGWTSGPRWLIWLTPIWLLAWQPAADRCESSRLGRALGLVAVAVSVFSCTYPAWNPWRHPWLYQLMESQGWIRY